MSLPTFTSAWFIAHEAEQRAKKATQRLDPSPPRKLPMSRLSEAEIQQSIAAYLDSHGRECFYVWHRMDQPTTCRVGTPDFVGWIRGKPFALEVKRPGAKETREQAGELLRGQLAGAKVAVVHSLGEAVQAVVGF